LSCGTACARLAAGSGRREASERPTPWLTLELTNWGNTLDMSGSHDVAQICRNGHVITAGLTLSPELGRRYCEKCGAETISACPECGTNIRGYYSVPGVIAIPRFGKPAFCPDCGKPFPWTAAALAVGRELAMDEANLSADERESWANTLPDLIVETPKTQLAIVRFKKFMAKASVATAGAMRDIVVDIASEAVKKALFPGL
jgi:hypothetical protein